MSLKAFKGFTSEEMRLKNKKRKKATKYPSPKVMRILIQEKPKELI